MPHSESTSHPSHPLPTGSGEPASRLRSLLTASLPRTVGYGLFAMFGLDLVQQGFVYGLASFQTDGQIWQANAQLCEQLIERAGVPLVAYALVFMETRSLPSRASRAARKVLSWAALFAVFAFLGLAILSVVSGVQLYRLNAAGLGQQRAVRQSQLNQVETQLPKMASAQVLQILAELSPVSRSRLRDLTPEQAATSLARAIKPARDEAETQFHDSVQRARRDQMIYSGKYGLGGLGLAVIMLLIAESTRPAREARVFLREGDAPNLKFEDSVARGFGRAYQSMERLGDLLLPDLNSFRWYRRFRRWLRREK